MKHLNNSVFFSSERNRERHCRQMCTVCIGEGFHGSHVGHWEEQTNKGRCGRSTLTKRFPMLLICVRLRNQELVRA